MILNFDDYSIDVERVDENNRKQGKATIEYNNGDREETYYIDDIKNGESTYYFDDDDYYDYYEVSTYVNGVKQGPALYYSPKGRSEYNYVDGVITGVGTSYFTTNGFSEVWRHEYINGKRVGAGTITKYNYNIIKTRQTFNGPSSMSYNTIEYVFYKNGTLNGFSIQNVFGEDSKYIIRYYVDGFQTFALRANTSSKYGFDFGYVNTNEDFITLFEEDDILFADNINDMKDILFKLNKPYGDRQ